MAPRSPAGLVKANPLPPVAGSPAENCSTSIELARPMSALMPHHGHCPGGRPVDGGIGGKAGHPWRRVFDRAGEAVHSIDDVASSGLA